MICIHEIPFAEPCRDCEMMNDAHIALAAFTEKENECDAYETYDEYLRDLGAIADEEGRSMSAYL